MSLSSLGNASPEEDVYIFPASFFQESLWLHDQLGTKRAIYNISCCFRLKGLLHLNVLEQVLNALVQCHEALRTTFMIFEGQLVQAISPTRFIPLQTVDLRNLPQAEQETEVLRLRTAEAQRPFDLARGPLLRTTVLQLAAEVHMLLLTIHHIIFDEWSRGVLCQELAALYTAFLRNQPSPLPELPIQYADFAVWQRQWLQGEVLTTQLSYWRQQLSGVPALLELPIDHPRPAIQTFQGAQHRFVLSQELADGLKALSRRKGVTLFMTLLAAFKVLLFRYTGQTDMVVGSPIANRNRSEMEGLIGLFVNTLVLRTDLSENPSFEEVLRRVGEVALGAYAHQDLPFEKLVEQLNPERNMSYNPLFQVLFVLRSNPLPTFDLPRLHLQLVEVKQPANFDLSLFLTDSGQGLIGTWDYSADLFESTTISRMAGHFQTLLEGIVVNPEQPISDLPLLTAAEHQQLLVEWNATQTEYPLEQCLHQLFEVQVERTPEAVAVIFEQEQLTYQELNQRANQLAHHLRTLGVGPDILVGICMERSLDLMIALLGIFKAGGAYVPLDPDYPQERLTFMLEDAQIPILLTHTYLQEHLPKVRAHVICLDTDWPLIAQANRANPASRAQPHHLAYVIYTSGSTGKPKGVMISHRAICNRIVWMQTCLPLTQEDRVLQKTPFSFDASIWEFYAPLLAGAQLIMAQPGGHRDSEYLIKTIIDSGITVLQLVPSLLRVLLEKREFEHCKSLKRVFCGGEELPIDLQRSFFSRMSSHLYNLYGPTESAIDATMWACKPEDTRDRVPIGRPIANTQIYILDQFLHPLPIGVAGELHIGGVGLARGYLNQPELTAKKFIAHPFSSEVDARLYKSGDAARYLPDGSIEFLGRLDHQEKIRGFRIELGEIEVVLRQHLGVQEAVVVAWENRLDDKRLVAYIVPDQGQAIGVSDLRSHVMKQLPTYMVPSAFVLLETLPLTPNGKVDRRALPKVEGLRAELETAFVAPQAESERAIAAIWQEVLGIKNVGIHDNFFDLGGNSLLLAQVNSKLQTMLKRDIALLELFEYPTVSSLVEHLNAGQSAASSPEEKLGRAEVRRQSTRRQQQFRQQRRSSNHT